MGSNVSELGANHDHKKWSFPSRLNEPGDVPTTNNDTDVLKQFLSSYEINGKLNKTSPNTQNEKYLFFIFIIFHAKKLI